MKKKILVIGGLPPPTGGMETVMKQMCDMNFQEYELIPFNVSKNKIIKSNIFFNLINFIYRCIKLFITIIIKKPSIIHIHVSDKKGFWQKAVYFQIAKLLRKKTALHMHGANFKEFYEAATKTSKKIIQNVLNNADKIIVLSESWKKYYSQISKKNNIAILNNAVEDINFESYKRIYPRDKFIVLFLSNICKRKGAYDLMKAISQIKNKKMRFVFVGPYENKEQFFDNIDKLNIKNKCIFIGEVLGAERFKYFASADLFILPSYAEGLPVAILEAMSFGLPIISTNVGAIPEVLKKENGLVINPGEIDSLRDAIMKIYFNKEKIDYRKNNIAKINKQYTQKVFQSELKKIYDDIQ